MVGIYKSRERMSKRLKSFTFPGKFTVPKSRKGNPSRYRSRQLSNMLLAFVTLPVGVAEKIVSRLDKLASMSNTMQ